jgi:hypothetical protein
MIEGIGKTNSAIITGSGTGGDLIQALNKLDSTDSGRKVLLKRYGSFKAEAEFTKTDAGYENLDSPLDMVFLNNRTYITSQNNYRTYEEQYQYLGGEFKEVGKSIDTTLSFYNMYPTTPAYDANDSDIMVVRSVNNMNGGFNLFYKGAFAFSKNESGWHYIGKRNGVHYVCKREYETVYVYVYDPDSNTIASDATWTITCVDWDMPYVWWGDSDVIYMAFFSWSYISGTSGFRIYKYAVKTGTLTSIERVTANRYIVGAFDKIFVVASEADCNNSSALQRGFTFEAFKIGGTSVTKLDFLTKYASTNHRVFVNNAAKHIIVCTETNVDVYDCTGSRPAPKNYDFKLPTSQSGMSKLAVSSPDGKKFAIVTRDDNNYRIVDLRAIDAIDSEFSAIEDNVYDYDYLTFTGITTGNTSGNYVEVKTVIQDTVTIDLTIAPEPDEIEFEGGK